MKTRTIKHASGTFTGKHQQEIFYQSWLPEDESLQAVLLLVHGLAEHCGRYGNPVNYFVPQGYAVYGLDHIGHGQSPGERVFVNCFADFTDTLNIYVDKIKQWQPDIPIFIVGHSMGGLISTVYLLEHQQALAGAVLSAPAVKVSDDTSKFTISLGNILSWLWPKLPLVQLAADDICRDPAVVQAYVDDPLVYNGKITARLAAELIHAMQRVEREAAAITLPLLILQGAADRLVNPAGTQMLYDKVSSPDKQIKIYNGFYHELFNEPEHKQVLGDVETWLRAHL